MRIDGTYPQGSRNLLKLSNTAAAEILRAACAADGEQFKDPETEFLNKGYRRIPRNEDDYEYAAWLLSRMARKLAEECSVLGTNKSALAVYRHDWSWWLVEFRAEFKAAY